MTKEGLYSASDQENGLVFDGLPGHLARGRALRFNPAMTKNHGRKPRMRRQSAQFLVALTLAALTLAACAKRNELPVNTSLNEDDDTFCRANNVAAGSPEYVACRRDRDVQ